MSDESCPNSSSMSLDNKLPNETEVIANTALVAHIEVLEAENKTLRHKLSSQKPKHFRLENIASNNSLVRFYTGFQSYEILLLFFEFLGPSVNELHYWGSKSSTGRRRRMKLDPLNQLLLTLMKLRLNLSCVQVLHHMGVLFVLPPPGSRLDACSRAGQSNTTLSIQRKVSKNVCHS